MFAPERSATAPAGRQRQRPDARIVGEDVSSQSLHGMQSEADGRMRMIRRFQRTRKAFGPGPPASARTIVISDARAVANQLSVVDPSAAPRLGPRAMYAR